MVRVIKGNRELVIRDDELAAYLADGYAAIDNRGNVIAEGKAMSYSALMKENTALKRQIQLLNERIRNLQNARRNKE